MVKCDFADDWHASMCNNSRNLSCWIM